MPRHINNTLIALLAATMSTYACSDGSETGDRASVRVEGVRAAIVNGDPIYLSDLELEAAAQGLIAPGDPFTPDNEAYQMVLDQLVDQRLLAQESLRRSLDDDPNAQHRLNAARERILTNLLMESLVAENVTEDAIRAMYAEQVQYQQLDDEVRISLITVDDRETAEQIVSEYESGTEFSSLAIQFSTDTSTRLDGGDLGYIRPNGQPEPLASTIADTATGEISSIFETSDGWQVLKVDDRRQSPPQTLEEMRPKIVAFLNRSELTQIVNFLRVNGEVAILEPGLPPSETDG
ncbi:MAG: peptidylprolyl isomerase [Pseudomonadota bacterium]